MLSGNVFYYRNQLDQFKSITVENVIGRGGFGTVYRAILDGYGAIAVKDQIATKSNIVGLVNEARIALLDLKHSITLKKILLGVFNKELGETIPEKVLVFTNIPKLPISITNPKGDERILSTYELVDGAELEIIIRSSRINGRFTAPDIIKRYISDLLLALEELVKHNIAHRDIKPTNIMLQRGSLKLIDFGLACFYGECPTVLRGSLNFLPPEAFAVNDAKNFEKMDIFALGNVFLFLLTHTKIWELVIQRRGLKHEQLGSYLTAQSMEHLKVDVATVLEQTFRKAPPEHRKYFKLVKGMLNPDHVGRYNIGHCHRAFALADEPPAPAPPPPPPPPTPPPPTPPKNDGFVYV